MIAPLNSDAQPGVGAQGQANGVGIGSSSSSASPSGDSSPAVVESVFEQNSSVEPKSKKLTKGASGALHRPVPRVKPYPLPAAPALAKMSDADIERAATNEFNAEPNRSLRRALATAIAVALKEEIARLRGDIRRTEEAMRYVPGYARPAGAFGRFLQVSAGLAACGLMVGALASEFFCGTRFAYNSGMIESEFGALLMAFSVSLALPLGLKQIISGAGTAAARHRIRRVVQILALPVAVVGSFIFAATFGAAAATGTTSIFAPAPASHAAWPAWAPLFANMILAAFVAVGLGTLACDCFVSREAQSDPLANTLRQLKTALDEDVALEQFALGLIAASDAERSGYVGATLDEAHTAKKRFEDACILAVAKVTTKAWHSAEASPMTPPNEKLVSAAPFVLSAS